MKHKNTKNYIPKGQQKREEKKTIDKYQNTRRKERFYQRRNEMEKNEEDREGRKERMKL